jgi:hypothetical protein
MPITYPMFPISDPRSPDGYFLILDSSVCDT